jgi:hypothetical protein
VLSGLLLYPLDQARAVLGFYGEFIKTAPDELTMLAGFLKLPDGMAVLFLSPVYFGPLEEGEQALTPLRTFGRPLADQIQPVACDAHINAMKAIVPKGRHYFIHTQSLEALRAETIGHITPKYFFLIGFVREMRIYRCVAGKDRTVLRSNSKHQT